MPGAAPFFTLLLVADAMQAGLKPGTKLMLIGTPSQQVAATKSLTEASASNSKEWDAPVQNEPLEKQAIHAKVSMQPCI